MADSSERRPVSLKTDVEARGVKLTDLAKELGESYGNLYTALDREHKGEEVRHKSVLARIEKIREWLATERRTEARVVAASGGSEELIARLRVRVDGWWHGKPGWSYTLDFAGVHCGDMLTRREGDDLAYYRVLRLVTTPRGATYVDVYGGAGMDKDQKHERRFRSFTLEALGLTLEEAA